MNRGPDRGMVFFEGTLKPDPLTPKQESMLQTFLSAAERPTGTLCYVQLRGFLFGMLGGPALVPPSQWIPVIFGEGEAGYCDTNEANAVIGALMACYNATAAAISSESSVTLHDVGLTSESDEDFQHWSRGFVLGLGLVRDAWDAGLELLEEDEIERFETVCTVLTIWADSAMYKNLNELADLEMKRMLVECRKAFVPSINFYAMLGLAIYQVTHPRPQGTSVGQPHRWVGRNDPCPCGSGKKYKKCCLN